LLLERFKRFKDFSLEMLSGMMFQPLLEALISVTGGSSLACLSIDFAGDGSVDRLSQKS